MELSAIEIIQEVPKYSENLFSKEALFLNQPIVNVTEGSATISYDDGIKYNNTLSAFCFMQSYKTTDTTFNFGTTFATTIKNTGNHLFSFRINNPNTTVEFFVPFDMAVNVFVNGNPTYEITLTSIGDYEVNSKKWVAWGQSMSFEIGDEVDFTFKVFADLSYFSNSISFQIGGFKLEFDDRYLGLPSMYSEPRDILLTATETIDVPSIASNDYTTVVGTLTGAEVGDYVQLTYPTELIALGLLVSYPIVTDTDEISFTIYNPTGGALNPASGDYTFKIIK
jgi:hypothetical protein